MANPCILQVTPSHACPPTQGNEFNFHGLYLYHTYVGPNSTQSQIIVKKDGIGTLTVNNWVIRDGLSSSAKVIARARGLHIYAGDWHNSFSIVFQDERFKGSTLQVMGMTVKGGEWAIVGGTGQFAMATGVIKKRVHQRTGEGTIIELMIDGFCPLLKGSSSLVATTTKIGHWGGNGGSARDITEPPKRLKSITICSGDVVDSIAFSYVDQAGQKHTEGPWGGPGGSSYTIELSDSEFVKEVSGTFAVYARVVTVIHSIKLVTNVKTYGPFGHQKGTSFSVPVQGNSGVAGFFGRSGKFLDAIGVYIHPL